MQQQQQQQYHGYMHQTSMSSVRSVTSPPHSATMVRSCSPAPYCCLVVPSGTLGSGCCPRLTPDLSLSRCLQRVYRALYDYAAQDHDEVSFRDGDVIINAQPIDEGWMYGTVQRTGKSGMLPANYVECCN